MAVKRTALLTACVLAVSSAAPGAAAQAEAAPSPQNITGYVMEATSPASLTMGRVTSDGWTEGGTHHETGYWAYLDVVTEGILPGFFLYDPNHGQAFMQELPPNVAAWSFSLDTRTGHRRQATLHFDFITTPSPETWDLTLTFDVNVSGESDSVTTSFEFVIPPYGGTAVTTPPAITPPPVTPGPSLPGDSGSGSGSGDSENDKDVTYRPPSTKPGTGGNGSNGSGSNGNGDDSSPETRPVVSEEISDLFRDSIQRDEEAGILPVVTIEVSGEEGVAGIAVYAKDILDLIASNGTLVIKSERFTVSFSTAQMSAWELDEDSVVVITAGAFVEPENPEDAELEDLLQSVRIEVNVSIDGVSPEDVSAELEIDISGLGLTQEQLARLSGAMFLEEGAIPLEGGLLGGIFSFAVDGNGEYGLMMLPDGESDNEGNDGNNDAEYAERETSVPTTPVTPVSAERRLVIGSAQYTSNGVASTGDAAPFMSEEGPMLPLRLVMEGLNASVTWSEATRSAEFLYNGNLFAIQMDSVLPGGSSVPTIVNNRAFVPLSYLSDVIGVNLSWDEASQTIVVSGN